MFINRHNLTIEKFTAKDDNFGSMGILITKDATYAGNGHLAIKVEKPEVDEMDFPETGVEIKQNKNIEISQNMAKKLVKSVPKKPRIPILENIAISTEDEKTKFVIFDLDNDSVDVINAKTEEPDFPDLEPFLEIKSPRATVGLNAKYLKEICAWMEKFNSSDYNAIELTIQEPHEPVIITATNPETGQKATACIMPLL